MELDADSTAAAPLDLLLLRAEARNEQPISATMRYRTPEALTALGHLVTVRTDGALMDRSDYLRKYQGYTLPEMLLALIDFSLECETEDEQFADGFYLWVENNSAMFETYSTEPEFTNAFISIGSADGMGSEYAFWLRGEKELSKAPIVVFGGEGGVSVVASTFEGLLRILSFDAESNVGEEWVDYTPSQSKPSPLAPKFHRWLESRFGIERLTTEEQVMEIVEDAQKCHGSELKAFVERFHADD